MAGPLVFVATAAYSLYSQHLILDCKDAANERRTRRGDNYAATYGEVAGACLGPVGQVVTDVSVCLVQLGVCIVFFDFLAESFEAGTGVDLPHYALVAGFLPFATALSLPRDMKAIAPYSTAANAATLLALGTVFACASQHVSTEGAAIASEDGLPAALLATVPLFVGSCLYSFEGQTLILPVKAGMQNSEDFRRVMDAAFVVVAAVLLSVGEISYAAFGDIADVPITAELQARGFDMKVVNMLLCGSVLLTFPLQLIPAVSIIEERLLGIPPPHTLGVQPGPFGWLRAQVASIVGRDPEEAQAAAEKRRTAARVATVAALAGVATAVPNIGLAVALVGAGPGSVVALIMPPLMHFVAIDRSPVQRVGHVLLIAASSVFCLYGTFTNVEALIGEVGKPKSPLETIKEEIGPSEIREAICPPEFVVDENAPQPLLEDAEADFEVLQELGLY